MAAQRWSAFLLLAFLALGCAAQKPILKPEELEVSVELGETKEISFHIDVELDADVLVTFSNTSGYIELSAEEFVLSGTNKTGSVTVKGVKVTSITYLRIATCRYKDGSEDSKCPLNIEQSSVHIKVVHSNALSIVIIVVGWMYFVAWSVSFYPQIWLNFKRKSVIGLNFDFLQLNIIGFTCYTIYNALMYFDSYIQTLYHKEHVDALNPVLLNDVVFALHALFACIVTVVQCLIYERGTQRVSYICMGLSSVFILFAAVSLVLSVVDVLSWLQFINNLSYVKMGVTLSKYVPQAILNYRRKSTIGWSIGNVLLDFAGGTMDICQMVLQAINTDDWSGFYGNPVKFGLGLVSIVFDVFFIVQHYCLYRHVNDAIYEGITNSATSTTISQNNVEAGSTEGVGTVYGANASTVAVRDNNS
uniref:Cystinosin homolog n=1 Tax=Steinernema glaseri TaxID=37863 RepID=A0A1I7ZEK1_9BILA